MPSVEESLQRWMRAGVLDESAAERIRVFEAAQERPSGIRWQVLLALIFGALLLAAGVSLFVAAHWDELSPGARFVVVLAMIAVLHIGAMLVRPRFERLAIVLHGVGTVAAGAGVALVGQIFNVQEHWPAGVLIWALCALAGWALLRDQIQQTIFLLLAPAWIICEWSARTEGYRGSELVLVRMVMVFAAVYLTGFLQSKKKLLFGLLFSAGAIALVIGTTIVGEYQYWHDWQKAPAMPFSPLLFGWICITLLPLLVAWRLNRPSLLPVAFVAFMAIALPHLYKMSALEHTEWFFPRANLVAHALVALVAAVLAWWGVQQRSRALVNYGIVCFALAVLWFYFSSIMGKLERSFSLIVLGLLFLGGGWALEKMRRKLVRHIEEAV